MLSSSEDITNPRSSNPFFPLSYLLFFFFLLYCSFQPQPLVFFLIVAPPCAPVRGRKKKKHRKQFSNDARISREQKQEGRKGKANVHVLLGLFLLLVFFIVVYMKPIYAFAVGYVNLYSLLSHSSYANKPVSFFRF